MMIDIAILNTILTLSALTILKYKLASLVALMLNILALMIMRLYSSSGAAGLVSLKN